MGLFGNSKNERSVLKTDKELAGKKFSVSPLRETCSPLMNPGRGWYEIYHFNIEDVPDLEELKWCLRENQTLALLRFDLGAVRSRIISEQELQYTDEIFDFFEEAGKRMILRFAYDTKGKGQEKEPSDIGLILYHISQLGRVVKKHEKSVFVFQGLLIGSWGEMHHTLYGSKEDLCVLADAVSKAIGRNIFMAVRRPVHYRMLSDLNIDRLGFFNDGLFGSDTHLGTFGEKPQAMASKEEAWCAEDEIRFTEKICKKTANGGEVVRGDRDISFEETVNTLKRLGITYLNCVYDERLLSQWKEKTICKSNIWQEKTWYDYIGAHLGYRLLITEVKAKITWSGTAIFKIKIQNTGFAPLYEKTRWSIQIDDLCKSSAELSAPLQKNRSYEIEIHIPALKGNVYLRIETVFDEKEIWTAMESNDTGEKGICIGYIF